MLSQFFYTPEVHFQPDGKVLKAWLSTNKNTMNNAGVMRPGMFNEPSMTSSLLFLLILLIELGATFWVNDQGMAIAIIVSFIFMDIALAVFSHRMEGRIVQSKNELLFNTNNLRGENIKSMIQRFTFYRNFFYVLILASGLYKGISFYLLYTTLDSMTICVIVAYFLAAILHIYNTGYAFAYWNFQLTLSNQFKKFMNTEGGVYKYEKDAPRQTAIETTIPLKEASTSKHAIVLRSGTYFFETKGILLDTELSELISKQVNNEQQRIIAIEGVRLQCAQLTW